MSVQAILLGVAQDAGLPQAGCSCPRCLRAWREPAHRQFASCLGLVDPLARSFWMVDATPDFREQLHLLQSFAPDCAFSGIFLTHLHMGHYSGLVHLGKEAMHTHRLPVYATASSSTFLTQNLPWSQLVEIANIEMNLLTPGETVNLSKRLSLHPFLIPHRGEYGDTLAYQVTGEHKKLFYCPDIDSWSQDDRARELVQKSDIALLDGTFFSPDELPNRDLAEIPHPTVQDSAVFFAGSDASIQFIHLNHTNPLWEAGPEQTWLLELGFGIGKQGQTWRL